MSQEWMIDVLLDLRKFAGKNSLERLAEQLDDTIHIAVAEISESTHKCGVNDRYDNRNGSVHRTHQL